MTALIHPIAIEAQALCHDMTKLAYDYGEYEDYITKGKALKAAITQLVDLGEYGALGELFKQTSLMLEPSTYERIVGRKPYTSLHLRFEALVFHLENFGAHPGETRQFVWGDAALDDLLVKSSLRSELPTNFMGARPWLKLGGQLAKTGSVAAWDQLFTRMSEIEEIALFVQGNAVLSLASFPPAVLVEHAELFDRHIDRYVANSGSHARYFTIDREYSPLSVQGTEFYDALFTLGREEIAYRYMNNDILDEHNIFKTQLLMHKYQWIPDHTWTGFRDKRQHWGRNETTNSIILYLLTLENETADLIFSTPREVFKALSYHGTTHDFGTIEFPARKIEALMNTAFDLIRGRDKYQQLKAVGFSDEQLALCERLNQERLERDLGL
ncbi:hypothetical protein [Pseudomonas sp. S1(2024)]|uniref:hypothetical protein n=1 Tax=Pseudomonas sp. S1(2024) TaxID=3390191 RepID=UPI00397E6E6B